MSLVILRAVAAMALILLLWNPASSRVLPSGDQPIVLLDASLSMSGASWQAALDSARGAGGARNALIWRFGTQVDVFDTTPPHAGASRLGPALEAAAARAGEVIVVTDGKIDDAASIPADLLRRPRVILGAPAGPAAFDAYVASVDGTRHVTRTDTVRLRVSYGAGGTRETGNGKRARLAVTVGDRQLISQNVVLPDSGTVSTELTFPVSRFPFPGWHVLDVRLDGVDDAEARDNTRQFAIEVSLEPAAVILASPPDYEARFLARTLSDVARIPVKTFVETEPGRWRDAATLALVSGAELSRAVANARLLAAVGDPGRTRSVIGTSRSARLLWATNGQAGDWYVDRPQASLFSSALAGVLWDSLPPATAVAPATDSSGAVALTARLARRGPARPIVRLDDRGAAGGGREARVSAAGLWRWAFRGGAAEEAYRGLVAALVDWLLGERRAGNRERAVLESFEVPNGLPVVWRWTGADDPRPLAVTLRPAGGGAPRTDTLRFDGAGRAQQLLPPGVYRYALSGGSEQGVVAVETWSDEWLPHAPSLRAQPGEATARVASTGLRDRWWLFVIAIAALATEWALRRRQGLP